MNTRLLRRIQKQSWRNRAGSIWTTWIMTPGHYSYPVEKRKQPACGTVGCIAGWTLLLSKAKKWHATGRSWPSEFNIRLRSNSPGTKRYAKVVSDRIDHFIKTKGGRTATWTDCFFATRR